MDENTGFTKEQALLALEHNLWSMWSHFGRGPGCHLYEADGAMWFDTPIPTVPYHALMRFTGTDDIDRRIDRIVAHFNRQNVPFMWVIHPTSPPEMEDRLKARGLQEAEVVPGMVIHLSQLPEPDPPPDGFEIREIITSDDVKQVLEFITWRWNVPTDVKEHLQAVTQPFKVGHAGSKTRAWAAFKDGAIVSKVTTHYGDAGDVGLYGVATRQEFRGLGLARTLILEALKTIYEDNYQIGLLHSSPMAESLYQKIGFKTVATFFVYTSTGAPL